MTPSPFGVGRASLGVLFVTVFLDMVGYGIIVPLLPFIAEEYGADALLVGLLVSLYALMQMFGGPFLGGLSDRTGRRPVILACLLGASIAYLMLGLAGSLAAIMLALALAGLAGGTPATAQAYIADSTSGDGLARGLGVIGAAFGLGPMVGPALGGVLSLYAGLSAPALAASALALANFVFGYFVLRESLAPANRRMVPVLLLNPVSQVLGVVGIGGIRYFLLVILLLNLALAGLITNFPLFGEARFGWGPAQSGFFFAFVGVCAVVTQGAAVGPLRRLLGEGRMLTGGLLAVAVGVRGGYPGGRLARLAEGPGGRTGAVDGRPAGDTQPVARRGTAARRARLRPRGGGRAVCRGRYPRPFGLRGRHVTVAGRVRSPLCLHPCVLEKLVSNGGRPVLRIGIIILTAATALIHFRLAFLFPTPDVLFLLNGVGYLVLLGLLYLPFGGLVRLRPVIRLVLIAYTALTVALYFIITGGQGNFLAYADKTIEAALIVLLAVEAVKSRRVASEPGACSG